MDFSVFRTSFRFRRKKTKQTGYTVLVPVLILCCVLVLYTIHTESLKS